MLAASHEILEECIALGGSVTGEHGIGVEKIAPDAAPLHAGRPARHDARCARSSTPSGRANPHKIFPDAKVCVETRAPRRQAAL